MKNRHLGTLTNAEFLQMSGERISHKVIPPFKKLRIKGVFENKKRDFIAYVDNQKVIHTNIGTLTFTSKW